MTNSMNKAHQCFEACGTFSFSCEGYLVMRICARLVIIVQEAETANKNTCRRAVCIKWYGPSERSNRRSQWENNPKGC